MLKSHKFIPYKGISSMLLLPPRHQKKSENDQRILISECPHRVKEYAKAHLSSYHDVAYTVQW